MILVPVKNLENAKQRLAVALSPMERSRLAAAMLEDVLDTLARCPAASEVAVVTGDRQAQQLAGKHGFSLVEDSRNPGETGAIEEATRVCLERGASYTLVVPADIPLVQTDEIEQILAAGTRHHAVLVPSASGRGTNAALRRPGDLFPLRFGNDSFKPHLAAARATGKAVHVMHLAGVGLDVDEPSDLADLLRAPGCTRAQQLLRDWGMVDRLSAVVAE
jgi:2-phospho-L-lactate guanylyltransferase